MSVLSPLVSAAATGVAAGVGSELAAPAPAARPTRQRTPAPAGRRPAPAPARKGPNYGLLIGGGLLAAYFLTSRPSAVTQASSVTSSTPPQAAPPGAPGTPTLLTQVGASVDSFTLSWSAVPGATSYEVWQYQPRTQLATVNTNVATVGNLQANTHYQVFVVAVGPTGLRSQASPVTVVSTSSTTAPPTVPSVPQTPSVLATTSDSVTLEWPETAGAQYYQVVDQTTGQTTGPIMGTQATVGGLQPNTRYSFAVQACNTSGCSNPSGIAVAATQPLPTAVSVAPPPSVAPSVPAAPGAPTYISSQATSPTSASLTVGWAPVAGATQYRLYHSTGQLLATVTTTQATVQGLYPGASIALYVVACNAAGCSMPGPTASFRTAAPSLPAAPSAPFFVGARQVSPTSLTVTIGWQPAAGATGYRLVRTDGVVEASVGEGTPLPLATSVQVPNWYPGASLDLVVQACNPAGCVPGPAATITGQVA